MSERCFTNTAKSSDCLRDHFLLAMPGLSEGIFSHSITYVCEHGESGAMGIVINQPLDLSVGEIFEHLQITAKRDFSDEPVMAGGPVQIDHGFVHTFFQPAYDGMWIDQKIIRKIVSGQILVLRLKLFDDLL